MPIINFVLNDNTIKSIHAVSGKSVMETAIMNNVRGIDAECGGCCSCATCHVYVEETFLALIPPPDDMENELLDGVASERRSNSRLSCQLFITDACDGIVVHVPESQI